MDRWMDEVMEGEQGEGVTGKEASDRQRGRKRESEREAQNMRLKCNVLERQRERESRASHAVRRNCIGRMWRE